MFSFLLLLFCASTPVALGTSRTVTRSGDGWSVNLVEMMMRGGLRGKCSFVEDGQELELLYHETPNGIVAKATNPTVVDPSSEVRRCREIAAYGPSKAKFRTVLDDFDQEPETEQSLALRFNKVQQNIMSNDAYVSSLRPRFFGEMLENFGFTFGGSGGMMSGFGIHIGRSKQHEDQENQDSKFGVGFSLPFKLMG